jgi:sulfite reductase (ferredoxin)
VIDLVATLLLECDEKLEKAREALEQEKWAAGIYYSYSAMINAAKALLTSENTTTNTHASIIKDFDTYLVATNKLPLTISFEALVLQLNKIPPSNIFAHSYWVEANDLIAKAKTYRKLELEHA